jgi:hypothetical protein
MFLAKNAPAKNNPANNNLAKYDPGGGFSDEEFSAHPKKNLS